MEPSGESTGCCCTLPLCSNGLGATPAALFRRSPMDLNSDQVLRLAKQSKRESLELEFLAAWLDQWPNLPAPVRQFRHNPKRKFAWDYAWPDFKLLVDLQGATFIRGGHSRGVGQERDFEKLNDAVAMGFRPLLFGTLAMKNPIAVVEFVAAVLTNAREMP